MHDFYRKERREIFIARFSPPVRGIVVWRIKSNVIFQAKNQLFREIGVNFNGTNAKVNVGLESGNKISIKGWTGKKQLDIVWRENDIADALASPKLSDEYLIAKALCEAHAKSSSKSNFISGCKTNNFEASKSYAGHKLHLQLRDRIPFDNPFSSGIEKECFLIGNVLTTDCSGISHLGETLVGNDQNIGFKLSLIPCAPGLSK